MTEFNVDVVVACADLVRRAGATGFAIGYSEDPVRWHATAYYQGARLIGEGATPSAAALALAERLLAGATCRCGRRVALSADADGCRWTLSGARWEPACDAPPITVSGRRGDYLAMQQALAAQAPNRAARRRQKRSKP